MRIWKITGIIATLVIVVSMLGLHLALRATTLERVFERLPWWAHGLLLAAMAYLTLICMTGEDRAFIYFQF